MLRILALSEVASDRCKSARAMDLQTNRNIQSRGYVEVAMKIALLVLCFVFLPAQEIIAQERLSANQAVARKIEPGKTELFSIALNDGDYVNVSIGYTGKNQLFRAVS